MEKEKKEISRKVLLKELVQENTNFTVCGVFEKTQSDLSDFFKEGVHWSYHSEAIVQEMLIPVSLDGWREPDEINVEFKKLLAQVNEKFGVPSMAKEKDRLFFEPSCWRTKPHGSASGSKLDLEDIYLGYFSFCESVGSYNCSAEMYTKHNFLLTDAEIISRLGVPEKHSFETRKKIGKDEKLSFTEDCEFYRWTLVIPYLTETHFEERFFGRNGEKYKFNEHLRYLPLWSVNEYLSGEPQKRFQSACQEYAGKNNLKYVLDRPERREVFHDKASSQSVSGSENSAIGPGYYVGGRRFDLDGLPADD